MKTRKDFLTASICFKTVYENIKDSLSLPIKL